MTKYLPKQYEKAIQYVQINGRTKIAVRGQISEYIPNPTFEVVARPGAMEDYFKHGNPEGKSRREIFGEPMRSIPAFRDPAARLEVMNDLGIERTLMFPTLASLLEERMRDDPDLIMAVVHGLNQWMEEVWGFDYKSRIFTTPVIRLPIVDQAIAELNWAHERGARAILVRPAPVPGWKGPRSFALPEFDPFWKRSELGVLVAMHSSDSGYARYQQEWEEVRNRIHISPFWEEDLAELSSIVGVERVPFGSDWPHPEGLADPIRYVDELTKLTEPDRAKIMGGNMARLVAA
jgi:hypothetical protein